MPTKAVLLDALGTLVELKPPWTQFGDEASWRKEMAYYRDHAHEAGDPASLADLRRRCAELLGRELGREIDVPTLMGAVRFHAYPDAAPALAALRARGFQLVVVSNANGTLLNAFTRLGLVGSLVVIFDSYVVGIEKPDPRFFQHALEQAGARADTTVHVGDLYHVDVVGARSAGIAAVLLDVANLYAGYDCRRVRSLTELVELLANDQWK